MLQNAYFLAKIGADTAENEQHFADMLPKICNYPTGPLGPYWSDERARQRYTGVGVGRRPDLRRARSCGRGGPLFVVVRSRIALLYDWIANKDTNE